MSITVSIRSSETGKPQPKPGLPGAFGVTEPEGSIDNEVSVTIDEGHQVSELSEVLDAAGRAAATAFATAFPEKGVIEFVDEAKAADPDEKIEAPHICGPDCGVEVGVIPIGESIGDFLGKLRESIANSRAFRGVDTEIRSDEEQNTEVAWSDLQDGAAYYFTEYGSEEQRLGVFGRGSLEDRFAVYDETEVEGIRLAAPAPAKEA